MLMIMNFLIKEPTIKRPTLLLNLFHHSQFYETLNICSISRLVKMKSHDTELP